MSAANKVNHPEVFFIANLDLELLAVCVTSANLELYHMGHISLTPAMACPSDCARSAPHSAIVSRQLRLLCVEPKLCWHVLYDM